MKRPSAFSNAGSMATKTTVPIIMRFYSVISSMTKYLNRTKTEYPFIPVKSWLKSGVKASSLPEQSASRLLRISHDTALKNCPSIKIYPTPRPNSITDIRAAFQIPENSYLSFLSTRQCLDDLVSLPTGLPSSRATATPLITSLSMAKNASHQNTTIRNMKRSMRSKLRENIRRGKIKRTTHRKDYLYEKNANKPKCGNSAET